MLPENKLPSVPVIFVDGGSMSRLVGKSRVLQFFAAQYPYDIAESPTAASEEGASIEMFASHQDGEAAWDSAYLTCSPDLSRQASIRRDQRRLREA